MPQGNLRTPEVKVRQLQEKLHQSAKMNKSRRFHQLYDKVYSPWFLAVAWQRVRANKGASGPDGVSIDVVERQGVDCLLDELSEQLKQRTYRTGPVRRVYIPKANGKLRPLGIPNVRDRVVQAAVVLVLEPIIEADLPDSAYGFRPGRSAHGALKAVADHLLAGYTDVVDADLKAYFDTIPHDNLLKLVAERVVDRGILWLINQWLKAAVIEPDSPPGSAGQRSDSGTPQGGVISPLLANLYHACIPRVWSQWETTRRLGGKIVSYADDFVIMLRPGRGQDALDELERVCARLGLTLSTEKTHVVEAKKESFRFLGFEVQKILNPKSGKWWPRTRPSAASQQRVRERLRELMNPCTANRRVKGVIDDVNALLRGWGGYFHFGCSAQAMRSVNYFARQRLRKWLVRRRHRRGQGYTQYPLEKLYGTLGLYKLPTNPAYGASHASG
jgi:RNA-directed DNA polymerase